MRRYSSNGPRSRTRIWIGLFRRRSGMLKVDTKFAPRRADLERAHRAGFRCAELWLDAAVLAGWQTAAELARDYPFTYAMHLPNRLEQGGPALDQAVSLYRALDCRSMVIHQPMFDRY